MNKKDFDECYMLLAKVLDKAAEMFSWTDEQKMYFHQLLPNMFTLRDQYPD
jgi:hypothetical protein